jgi:hypothetical protein
MFAETGELEVFRLGLDYRQQAEVSFKNNLRRYHNNAETDEPITRRNAVNHE